MCLEQEHKLRSKNTNLEKKKKTIQDRILNKSLVHMIFTYQTPIDPVNKPINLYFLRKQTQNKPKKFNTTKNIHQRPIHNPRLLTMGTPYPPMKSTAVVLAVMMIF